MHKLRIARSHYNKVQEGNVNVRILSSGTNSILFNSFYNYTQDSIYSIFIFGDSTNTQVSILPDNFNSVDINFFKIRFLNFSVNYKQVNLIIEFNNNNKSDTINGVNYTGTNFLNYEAGTINFKVFEALNDSLLLSQTNINIKKEKVYNLVLYDSNKGNTLKWSLIQAIQSSNK